MMASNGNQDSVGRLKKKAGRPKGNSAKNKNSARLDSSSKPESPYASPNRYHDLAAHEDSDGEEAWVCGICCQSFMDPNAKLLECQRCKGHFCIRCLDKSEEVYQLLADSDLMWFCGGCREKVEKNIVTDVEIEKRCKLYMQEFEDRISSVERTVQNKCDAEEVKKIVNEELNRRGTSGTSQTTFTAGTSNEDGETPITQVMSEINERKQRELNIVVHGLEECSSDNKEDRIRHDKNQLESVFRVCDRGFDGESLGKVIRLGKHNKDKPRRPMLVTVNTQETKRRIFKGAAGLRRDGRFGEVKVANDLTKAEREQEKQLYNRAKDLEKQNSGEYIFRVRGPPWARKVVKMKREDR